MTSLWIIYLALVVAFLYWYVRSSWANDITYRQRMKMIDALCVLGSEEYLSAMQAYQLTSYDSHKREVFWGRNPYDLYVGAARNLIPRDEA